MKILSLLLITFIFLNVNAKNKLSPKIEKEIQLVFEKQEKAWNSGNLEKFMEGYWKSDKLVFVGSRGPTYGWQATLNSYKKGYPDKKTMGILKFETLKIKKIDKKTIFLIGKFELTRNADDLSGHFTLIWQKINGKWLIIADHSS
ncbi:MAG: nuclear transport factor 2 family protein [Mariniphaga sp.]|nr:nuclear transport factor 2 family protein [Mariniphaga sp.]